MKSETITVQQIFQPQRQYCVPFYQRAYVWKMTEQWEPLWIDIQAKANDRLSEATEPVSHFLGAVVLEPRTRKHQMGVEEVFIIDGQQRLTTLQYILTAISMAFEAYRMPELRAWIDSFRWNINPAVMRNPEKEIFKLWPTLRDRNDYILAIKISEHENCQITHVSKKNNLAEPNKIINHHKKAICFFYNRITDWIAEENFNQSETILMAIANSVLYDFKIVSITLEEQDDAQVIFETLNGRGAQLHATDLIRNYIFMQADKEADNPKRLYDSLWFSFEDDFWKEEQKRGRLKLPRLDWFVQTVLQVELREEIDIGRLYIGYQRFAKTKSAVDQLKTLNAYADHYKTMILGVGYKPIGRFGGRIKSWDASTTHALALIVSISELSDDQKNQIFDWIVSYFVRRAVCGLTAKNYNRVFNQQVKRLSVSPITIESIYSDLSALEGKSARWPRDDEFQKEWIESAIYKVRLDSSKIKAIFLDLEMAMRSSRTDDFDFSKLDKLDVEHILPVSWFEYWQLPDGISVKEEEIKNIDIDSPHSALIIKRERVKNSIGNLTLLHNGVNRSLQNYSFKQKRETFFAESNLHLNRDLMMADCWNENKIEQRGKKLFDFAKKIWEGPEGNSEKSWFIETVLTNSLHDKRQNLSDVENTIPMKTITDLDESWVYKNITFPPNTEFRANHKGQVYRGVVKNGVLTLFDGAEFSSPSSAATHITKTEVNGWKFWECRFPGNSAWQVIGTLRKGGK